VNKWGFLNLLLAGVLLGALALLAAMHTNPAKRNDYWLKGMDESPAPADYSVNANFTNGQTLQLPPEGTLPQGAQPYHYQGGVDDANKAGKELKSPLDGNDAAVLARGRDLFMRDCMPCHGVGGRGDGLVTATRRDGGFPPPPSLLAEHAKGLPDGYIYNYISRGGLLMPSYGAQIDAADRWKVVAWVREIQKNLPENAPDAGSAQALSENALVAATTPGYGHLEAGEEPQVYSPPTPTTVPTEAPAPAEAAAPAAASGGAAAAAPADADPWKAAQPLIAKSDCLSCHNPDHKVVGPAFKDVAARYRDKPEALAQLVKKVKAGGAGNWGQIPMAAHPTMSDADLETIIKGILSLSGGHAKAPSLKRVMELVHSGAPVRCPAVDRDANINGPAWLAGRTEAPAEVRRIAPGGELAALAGPAADGEAAKEAQP